MSTYLCNTIRIATTFLCTVVISGSSPLPAADTLEVINSQAPTDAPPSPKASLAKIVVPDGFQVTLFAGEPDVRQPIAMEIDDRGRLWVVECYSYTDGYFRDTPRDRVLIFTDRDNDGQFDDRKVFWDQGQRLTSLRWGFGGVWLTAAPNLIFIPDRNRDDVPDGEPIVMLDGFETDRAGHNMVNGLRWGPDGWLYGRHGILATSLVGRPGASPESRVPINCGIWRFHPTRHVFEVVVHGTTNPWGMDFDDHGHMFFTNNVIGHLFHAVPGAHFERMYGSDMNPYVYDLMPMCADHYHWDTHVPWQETREGVNSHPELGGGHSHCGGMIYLGDNWPDTYRNSIFMCNTHGKRLNCDRLIRHQSGYVATHGPDIFHAQDTWFRGVDLLYGPDGGVFISDWSDLGECHDHDGVHRTSGRIYKMVYGKSPAPPTLATVSANVQNNETTDPFDLQRLSNTSLIGLQTHQNDWFVRHARRILQERAIDAELAPSDQQRIVNSIEAGTVPTRLRYLWLAYSAGLLDPAQLVQLLESSDEPAVRAWIVRLLADTAQWPREANEAAQRSSAGENDPSVCLEWASALRRMAPATRVVVGENLVKHAEFEEDIALSLMIWYGIEPLVGGDSQAALRLFRNASIPRVRRNIVRRVTELINEQPATIDQLVESLSQTDIATQLDIMSGMVQALQGRRKVSAPAAWPKLEAQLTKHSNSEIAKYAQQLAVLFGSGVALDEVRAVALDAKTPTDRRRQALQSLIAAVPPDFAPTLQRLLSDRAVEDLAAQGLVQYDDPDTPQILINQLERLDQPARRNAIVTLTSRPSYAQKLLVALGDDRVSRDMISAADARQLQNLGDPEVQQLLEQHWGSLRSTPDDRKQQMEHYRELIAASASRNADLESGRQVFEKTCATCHKLYGRGAAIGPDLTGANRSNLDYLLENIVDPSAMVAAAFRTSVVELEDGRVLSGVVLNETDQRLELQTATELLNIDRQEVADISPTQQSLMPDGILQTLTDAQVVELLKYLQQ
jgi:putative membrane-bound dehydrogenase-like protein